MENSELKTLILKTHFKTINKVYPLIHKTHPQYTRKQIQKVLDTLLKDNKKHNVNKYFKPIFSSHPYAWMMDILDNQGTTEHYPTKQLDEDDYTQQKGKIYPNYYLVFVNINTRYACSYPLATKNIADVKQVIIEHITHHKTISLTSDAESSFKSDEITQYLKSRNISLYIVTDENHTSLSIIDSFIRRLRDMNTTNEKTVFQSHNIKYRSFSTHRMNKLVKLYNQTYHSSIQMTPEEMNNDINKERQYIAYCLIRKSKTPKYDIPVNHYVRIVVQRDPMKKRRFKISQECYKVTGRDGNNYFISASDGRRKSLPRWRLIDVTKPDGNHPANIRFAATITGIQHHTPVSIVSKEGKTYTVQFTEGVGDKVTKQELRRHHPQLESKVEHDFTAH